MVERLLYIQDAGGPIPSAATIIRRGRPTGRSRYAQNVDSAGSNPAPGTIHG